MKFELWLAYFFTELLLILVPGPAVVFVTTQGFRYNAIKSYVGALGIVSCNLLFFLLAAVGIGALMHQLDSFFNLIRIAGVIYLVASGCMMIRKSFKKETDVLLHMNTEPTGFRSFLQGFVIQAVNPKAILFFIALLPQFINERGNVPLQFLILGATSIIPETLLLMFYGWLSARSRKLIKENNNVTQWKERIAGLVLIGIAVSLLFLRNGP